jgi:hypothetical protein
VALKVRRCARDDIFLVERLRETCLPSDHAAHAGISAYVLRDSDPSQKTLPFNGVASSTRLACFMLPLM